MDLTPLDAVVRLAWLAAAVAFVIGLSRMSSPATARNGNLVSAGGMAVAVVAEAVWLLLRPSTEPFNATGWIIVLAGIGVGGGYGLYSARTVKMTAMPQLVSLFNAVGGGAAALIAIDEYLRHAGNVPGLQENVATVPRHHHRLDHVHGLAHRIRQADGPADHPVPAGDDPRRPRHHGADRPGRRGGLDLPVHRQLQPGRDGRDPRRPPWSSGSR